MPNFNFKIHRFREIPWNFGHWLPYAPLYAQSCGAGAEVCSKSQKACGTDPEVCSKNQETCSASPEVCSENSEACGTAPEVCS